MPDGTLTPAQYEILEVVWNAGDDGVGVTDVWRAIGDRRGVTRTTILNLIDRLERRGWLRRNADAAAHRFTAAITREQANADLAGEFVDEFFAGSPSSLIMSLLGTSRLDPDEIARLRDLLKRAAREGGAK